VIGQDVNKYSRVPRASLGVHYDTLGIHTRPAQPKTIEVPRETQIDAAEGVVQVRLVTVRSGATFQATGTQPASRINDIDSTITVSGEDCNK